MTCGLLFVCFCSFKGICAQEIHLCGEESGIEFIRQIAMVIGDDMEVRKYKRLTSLMVLDKAVGKTSPVAAVRQMISPGLIDVYVQWLTN